MKEEQGLVLAVTKQLATVRVGRHAECSSCGACGGSRQVIIEALNKLGAQPGQRVRFAIREQNVLTGAFVVFVLPLLLAAIGAGGGWLVGRTDNYAIGSGLIFFVLGLIMVKLFDRRVAHKQNLKPVIIEILRD